MFTDKELQALKISTAIAIRYYEHDNLMFDDDQSAGEIETMKEIQSKIERLLALIADAESYKI